jgi:hypothetical protein
MFCDPANQDASIAIKFITFFGYVGNSDAIITGAGLIDPEGCACSRKLDHEPMWIQ